MRKRFTLLELLIVIAILGILLTLLLPSLGTARKKAELVVCASNMKQITVSMNIFLKNNNLFFPIGIRNNWPYEDSLSEYDGRNLTQDEIDEKRFDNTSENQKRHEIYNCPSSIGKHTAQKVQRTYVLNNGQGSWYSPNDTGLTWLRWPDQDSYAENPVNMNHVNSASQMYMFTEYDTVSDNQNVGAVGHTNSSQGRYLHISANQNRLNLHGTITMNAVFVDSSMSVQRIGQLSQAKHWDKKE